MEYKVYFWNTDITKFINEWWFVIIVGLFLVYVISKSLVSFVSTSEKSK